MGEAIGQILPLAVGVALSPVPIIAIILMLGKAGFARVANLAGGMLRWRAQRLAVEDGGE